ncbi:MAG TPA: hypothetical protein VK821_19000 [Dehalococcoidia bacterium]|nr:hypothetical protein [Dehalococcoidia bacterium]
MAEPRRLLDRMRRSKADWRLGDLNRLYRGFGFVYDEGSKHRLYKHPLFPELYATVTRGSGALPLGYIVEAIRLIDLLLERGKSGDD